MIKISFLEKEIIMEKFDGKKVSGCNGLSNNYRNCSMIANVPLSFIIETFVHNVHFEREQPRSSVTVITGFLVAYFVFLRII